MPGKELRVWNLTPTSLGEAMKFGEMLAVSGVVPEVYRNNPAGIVAACEQGSHLGFTAMQSLQSIAVINGMPSLWGDALPALAMSHPDFESIDETYDADTMVATCKIKRRGMAEQKRTFSWTDAERAELTTKDTYRKYPQRMLKARARAWAIRDVFPDALKGCGVVEEVRDIPANAATEEDYRHVVSGAESTEVPAPEATSGMGGLDVALDKAATDDVVDAEVVDDDAAELAEWEATHAAAIAEWSEQMLECQDEPALERVGHEIYGLDDGDLKERLRTMYGDRLKAIRGTADGAVETSDGGKTGETS